MASRYEVEVTVGSARDLKNVNWRHGDLKPYAVAWIDSGAKCSTRVDVDGGESPTWDDKLLVPLPPDSRLDDAVLYVDVVHANAGEGVKPLVGSARLPLRDVLDDAGLGGRASRTLRLKRPSGRPQGKLDVRVAVKEPARYYDPNPGYPAPQAAGYASRDPYGAPAAYGAAGAAAGYGAYGAAGGYGSGGAPPYAAVAPPAGYPSSAYGATQPAYGGSAAPQPAYSGAYGVDPALQDPNAKTKKAGMGTGAKVAVGAAAGALGALALVGGASYLEDKFEDHVAEKVEDDLAEEDAYGGGYDDDY